MLNTPDVRFKGYTEPWEQCKLDSITDVRDGTHDSPQYVVNGHPFVTSKNIKDGYINYDDIQFISDADFIEINKRSKVDINDILMGMIGTIGNIALVRETPNFAIKNVALIKNTGQIFYHYLYHCLQSPYITRQLSRKLDGGTQKFIALNKVRELDIPVPSIEEQHKIGDYVEGVDNLITLHQRKCDEMSKLKKYMLQKMFPKNGELFPEIRFSGFTDPWEQLKLGEVVNVYSGRDYKYLDEGDIPVYGTGGYMLSVSEALSETDDAIGIGRKGTIDNPFIMRAPFWTVDTLFYCIPKEKFVLDFVFSIYQNIKWKIMDESTGVPSLSKTAIGNVDVMVPSEAEQKKLGRYFSQIDNLITTYQRKCDELKEFKKYMLQNMFPKKG